MYVYLPINAVCVLAYNCICIRVHFAIELPHWLRWSSMCMYMYIINTLLTGSDHLCFLPVSPTALTETRRTSSDGHTEGMEKAQESDAESLRSTETAQSFHYHSGTNSYM